MGMFLIFFGEYKFHAILADIGRSRVRMSVIRASFSDILNPSQNALRHNSQTAKYSQKPLSFYSFPQFLCETSAKSTRIV